MRFPIGAIVRYGLVDDPDSLVGTVVEHIRPGVYSVRIDGKRWTNIHESQLGYYLTFHKLMKIINELVVI